MKKTILFIALLIFSSNLFAQDEKLSIGILPFTYVKSSASAADVISIQESVINSFVKTKRFNIVDRSKMDALNQEKELQKGEDFIDGSVIEQGKSVGAKFLISGHVISAMAEGMRTDDGTVTYKAKLIISLKVINIETSEITTSETIEPKSGSMLTGMIGMAANSPQVAISKAISSIQEKVDKFVDKNFPVTFSVVEIQEKEGDGAAKQILISGGSAFGLKKGTKLKIVEIVEVKVGNKTKSRKKEIGEVKIIKVEDEDFSICEVKSGGADVSTKFDAKVKLEVVTLTE